VTKDHPEHPAERTPARHPASHHLGVRLPTRNREGADAVELLRSGRSVIVTGFVGEGLELVAHQIEVLLTDDSAATGTVVERIRCTDVTTTDQISDAVGTVPSGDHQSVVLLEDAHRLTEAALLHARAVTAGRPTVWFVDGDVLHRSGGPGAAHVLPLTEAWLSGELERMDLRAVPRSELLDLVHGSAPNLDLDDLQLNTLVTLAEGNPGIALDLAQEALAYPRRVPRRYPRPGLDVTTFGQRPSQRMAPRYQRLG
jgi:hypothetical protein